jgi:hypothetical protein
MVGRRAGHTSWCLGGALLRASAAPPNVGLLPECADHLALGDEPWPALQAHAEAAALLTAVSGLSGRDAEQHDEPRAPAAGRRARHRHTSARPGTPAGRSSSPSRAAPAATPPPTSRASGWPCRFVLRAAGGPVDVDRYPFRPRFHQVARCVRAGVGEQPRALADDHGADEQGDLVDKRSGVPGSNRGIRLS